MIVGVRGPFLASSVSGPVAAGEALLQTRPGSEEGQEPTLATLSVLRSQPFTAWNLLLDSQDLAVRELADFGPEVLLETTPASAGRQPAQLWAVEGRLSSPRIVMGASFYREDRPMASFNAEIVAAEVEYQLTCNAAGDDQPVRAGLIGLLELSATFAQDPVETMLLQGYAAAQAKTGAPLFIQCEAEAVDAAVSALTEAGAAPEKLVFSGLFAEDHSDDLRLALLRRGVSLVLQGPGLTGQLLPGLEWRSDRQLVDAALRLVEEGFAGQLLLSSGVGQRQHLRTYGGFGYDHAWRVLAPRLRSHLPPDQCDRIERDNALALLAWWTPPAAEVVEEAQAQCTVCETFFPLSQDHLEKFDFKYCGGRCLGKHAKLKWAYPLPR